MYEGRTANAGDVVGENGSVHVGGALHEIRFDNEVCSHAEEIVSAIMNFGLHEITDSSPPWSGRCMFRGKHTCAHDVGSQIRRCCSIGQAELGKVLKSCAPAVPCMLN